MVTVDPGLALTKSALMVPKAPVSDAAADTVIVPVTGVDGDVVVRSGRRCPTSSTSCTPAATRPSTARLGERRR